MQCQQSWCSWTFSASLGQHSSSQCCGSSPRTKGPLVPSLDLDLDFRPGDLKALEEGTPPVVGETRTWRKRRLPGCPDRAEQPGFFCGLELCFYLGHHPESSGQCLQIDGQAHATDRAQHWKPCGASTAGRMRYPLHGEIWRLWEALRPGPDPVPGHDGDGLPSTDNV